METGTPRSTNDSGPAAYYCPSCRYNLRGLPEICTCPECGFECDPHAVVVELSPRRWYLNQVMLGGLVLAIVVLGTWVRPPRNGDLEAQLSFWGLVGGLIVLYFVAFCRKTGETSRLLLTRRGIRFDDRKLDRGWTGWSRIDRARYSWLSQRLHVIGRDNTKLYSIPSKELGSASIARECVHAINAQLRRYAYGEGNTPTF